MSEKEKKKARKGVHLESGTLARLEETARKLGIELRHDQVLRPGFAGGLCRVKGRWLLVVNKAATPLEQAETIAAAVASRPVDDLFLPPDVREVVEWAKKKRSTDAT